MAERTFFRRLLKPILDRIQHFGLIQIENTENVYYRLFTL
jgi:hypothetical protein